MHPSYSGTNEYRIHSTYIFLSKDSLVFTCLVEPFPPNKYGKDGHKVSAGKHGSITAKAIDLLGGAPDLGATPDLGGLHDGGLNW
jgi:hypothetical protein